MICSRFVFFVFEGNPEAVPEHETILSQLDEETNPQLAYLDDYNSQTVKQRAMNNVNSAFHAHQQKAQQFDSSSPTVSTNPLDKPKGMSVNRIVELQCAKSIGSLGTWTLFRTKSDLNLFRNSLNQFLSLGFVISSRDQIRLEPGTKKK